LLTSAPEREDVPVPSEEALLAVLQTAADKELTAYGGTVSDQPG
jgi:hypothetical protein